ncbi:MAG: hypothetical protein PHF00_07730, partial [Elusimicrobia bacterium]|nr:hypothetical protein [Elusimicrobiota bacterium]
QPRAVPAGSALRVQAPRPFRLRWSLDDWRTRRDSQAAATALGIHFVELAVPEGQRAPVRFAFFWLDAGRWEGGDFSVAAEVRRNSQAANVLRP